MDVSEQVAAKQRIIEACRDAEKANKAKSKFLSRMSHELRTPLNSIIGFGQLLLNFRDMNEKQTKNVNTIVRAGRHLLSLVDEVLDISKVEEGGLTLSREPVLMIDALNETIDLVQPLADKKHITLELELNEDIHSSVMADKQRLLQVLLNLITNSIKYNRENGKVSIHVNRQNSETLRTSIQDTGHGITNEDIPNAFQPFERLSAESSSEEGTGLGLPLCKRLVEAMNGRIGVKSELGKGSVFWMDLPLINNQTPTSASNNYQQPVAMS